MSDTGECLHEDLRHFLALQIARRRDECRTLVFDRVGRRWIALFQTGQVAGRRGRTIKQDIYNSMR